MSLSEGFLPEEEFISFIAVLNCTPDQIFFIHICGLVHEVTKQDIDNLKVSLQIDPDFGGHSDEEINRFAYITLDRSEAMRVLQGEDLTPKLIEKLKEASPTYIDC